MSTCSASAPRSRSLTASTARKTLTPALQPPAAAPGSARKPGPAASNRELTAGCGAAAPLRNSPKQGVQGHPPLVGEAFGPLRDRASALVGLGEAQDDSKKRP